MSHTLRISSRWRFCSFPCRPFWYQGETNTTLGQGFSNINHHDVGQIHLKLSDVVFQSTGKKSRNTDQNKSHNWYAQFLSWVRHVWSCLVWKPIWGSWVLGSVTMLGEIHSFSNLDENLINCQLGQTINSVRTYKTKQSYRFVFVVILVEFDKYWESETSRLVLWF